MDPNPAQAPSPPPTAARLVSLNPSATVGGAERVLLDLAAGLAELRPGWRLTVVAGAEGALPAEAAAAGAEGLALPMPGALARLGDWSAGGGAQGSRVAAREHARDPGLGQAPGRSPGQTLGPSLGLALGLVAAAPATLVYRRRLRRELARLAPDLVHTNGFKMHLLGALAAPPGVPVVWHLHDYAGRRPVMARLLRRYAGRAAAAIANSASVAADAEALFAGLAHRPPVRVVANGVDLERFHPPAAVSGSCSGPVSGPSSGPNSELGADTADLDRLAGLPPAAAGTLRVGLVATLARWKGHAVFLRALARLADVADAGGGLPPVRGYVVGGALYATGGSQTSLDELRAEAARLGLGDRVGFTGFVADPAAALRALDVAVHASTDPEPFGLAIAEAMACGRPVVVSRAGGAADLVTEWVDGLGHPPGDDEALAAALGRLARDPELRRRLGTAARATAERRFDRRRHAAEVAAIFEELLAGEAGR